MKKYILLLLCIVLALSLALVACNNDTNSSDFEYDEYTEGSGGSGGSNDKVLPALPSGAAAEPTILIHYHRNNSADYKTWSFWLWGGTVDAKDPGYVMQYQDDFGGIACYTFSELGLTTSSRMGIIPRMQSGWTKDGEADRWWDFSTTTADANNYYHIYITQGDIALYKDSSDIQFGMTANFTSERQIVITTKTPVKYVKIYEGSEVIAETKTNDTVNIRYNFPSGKQPDVSKEYKAEVTFKTDSKEVSCVVGLTVLFGTDLFNNAYYYDGELGAIYSSDYTTFKVWSPISTRITLNIYQKGNGTETPETHEMEKGDKGVWKTALNGDLGGKYYTYTVYNSTYPAGMEIVDPYAKSAGLNGQRGQIVDFSKTNPEGWNDVKPIAYDRNELVVWETHVADVTSSATWTGTEKYRKKFLGMTETGTTYTKDGVTVTTGFDHIKELGVNAVQLVPIFDQANNEVNVSFNWGYNPLNYNVLEGAYSTDATDGYVRIKEFKQLVQAYNQAGINIIMDVVYNHVSAAIGSNFDVLMPGYYFRYTNSGDMANGSGCGNETASDHLMFRKFMIDSTSFWAKEYKLGGFRFDLMGLHDIETMNQLVAKLVEINPSIVVYGEPWEGGSTPLAENLQADQKNANSFVGYGQFNDKMRDALIKGGLSAATETGWVTGTSASAGDASAIADGLRGCTAASPKITDPTKTINYVTCHDNYTLWDRIWATGLNKNREDYVLRARQMTVLANSIVMTSNGVSFMLAGEEFLRSKQELGATGDEIHNSYESSYKVNELDYARKITYANEFASYKKLVEFKTQKLGLKISEITESNYTVKVSSNNALITVNITSANGTQWRIVYANFAVGASGTIADLNGYSVYLDTLGTYAEGAALTAQTEVARYQVIIACKAA